MRARASTRRDTPLLLLQRMTLSACMPAAGEMGAKEDYIIANRLLVLDFLLSAERLLNHPDGLCSVPPPTRLSAPSSWACTSVAVRDECTAGASARRAEER